MRKPKARWKDIKKSIPKDHNDTQPTAQTATDISENESKKTKLKLVLSRMAARWRGANQAHHLTGRDDRACRRNAKHITSEQKQFNIANPHNQIMCSLIALDAKTYSTQHP